MALVCGCAIDARFRSGTALRVGLRMDWARDTGTNGSAEKVGCRRILSVRAKPDVLGILLWLDRVMGGLRARKPGRDRGGNRGGRRHRPVCAAVRGAKAAKPVRCRV